MSIAKRFNKRIYNIRLGSNVEYVSLEALKDAACVKVLGFYITETRFGKTASAILSENKVANLPKHLLSTVQDIMADDDATDAINKGLFGFTVLPYTKKSAATEDMETYYTVEWMDIEA